MNLKASIRLGLLAALAAVTVASPPAIAQQQQKPNILFIMGDDIGWMQPSVYHRGLMVGETPNIDRIANEGAIFMDYVAMQSCTSGRPGIGVFWQGGATVCSVGLLLMSGKLTPCMASRW